MAWKADGSIRGRVVVVTGASSGIGREAARAFAGRGAAVVLAARRGSTLHQAAEGVLRAGGRAMVVETDMRDEAQVHRLAERAIDAFGGIDVWVNNAGVGHFSRFEDTPPEVFAEVVHTTFFGTVHGTRAVLPHFRQRRRGVIINNASVAGRLPAPYHTAYSAAKHAVLGFADSLRMELRDMPGIHVCNLLPGPIDTPFWDHAANFSGHDIRALRPLHSPRNVAAAMVALAVRPRREVGVGVPVRLAEAARIMAPALVDRLWVGMIDRQLFGPGRHGASAGAVIRPMAEGRGAEGGWTERLAEEDRAEARRQRHRTAARAAGRRVGQLGGGGPPAISWTGLLALAVPVGAAAFYRAQPTGTRHRTT